MSEKKSKAMKIARVNWMQIAEDFDVSSRLMSVTGEVWRRWRTEKNAKQYVEAVAEFRRVAKLIEEVAPVSEMWLAT